MKQPWQIDSKAFYFANKIDTIVLPESISRIGDYAFYACWELLNIDVEPENSFYASENGVLYNKQKTKIICYPSQKSDINILHTDWFGIIWVL